MRSNPLLQLIFLMTLLLPNIGVKGQSLPVGNVLEDYYRRQQLLGNVDSTISFTSRPFYPIDPIGLLDLNLPKISNWKLTRSTKPDPSTSSGTGGQKPETAVGQNATLRQAQGPEFRNPKPETREAPNSKLFILPISLQHQYTTHHPYSLNDGEMIPARGYQTLVSAGIYAKIGMLSIQLRPEYVYAENKQFDGFGGGKGQSDKAWQGYYSFLNSIDLPERFGDKPYNHLFWGQSSIRLNYKSLSIGISNENMWWGPGMLNSLLMTNTSGGFVHATLNTTKPIRTKIGSFEGQLIAGRLDGSDQQLPKPPAFFFAPLSYVPKNNDWRYINGMVLSYQPKWVPGLFLGLTRSYMVYQEDMGNFPFISPLNKKNQSGGTENPSGGNQLRSFFGRMVLPNEHAEFYFEYGRDDLSHNVRDFILEPEYARAYIIGFRKLFVLNKLKERYLQFNMEVTQLEQNTTNTKRSITYFYTHPDIRHGYTNRGQLLGSGIGPGSDMQNMEISWHQGFKKIGFTAERYVHNNNFHYLEIKDLRSNWVDIAYGLLGEYNYKNFLFNCKAEMVRSINYQHNYDPIPGSNLTYWMPGKDIYNYQINLGITYNFY